MNCWIALIYGAAALIATAFFYVLLRWRRSPMAVKGMALVAGLCFLSGVLSGIWLLHLVSPGRREVAPTASKPSPTPSTSLSSGVAITTIKPTAQAAPRSTFRAEFTLTCNRN